MDSKIKGQFKALCNRTACDNFDAVYYNHSTKMYYCEECAHKINRVNPESHQIFGHELCTVSTKTTSITGDPYSDHIEYLPYEDYVIDNIPPPYIISDPYKHILDGGFTPRYNGKEVKVRTEPKIYRNDPCSCGSGLKYKKCCLK